MKLKIIFMLTLMLLILWVVPAGAGGWVVISLDEAPGPATAGEPLFISFMLLQHGQTPSDWATPEIHLTSTEGETIVFEASPTNVTGQYSANVIFPSSGQWQWKILATPFSQQLELPEQTVARAQVNEVAQTRTHLVNHYDVIFRWAAIAFLLLALLSFGVQQRLQPVAPVVQGTAD